MAESTLAITFGSGGRIPNIDGGHVSCGLPIPGFEVVIRNPKGETVAEGEQGEVTVRGPSLCSGYAGGNILNLLLHLKSDLSRFDFSGITVWQAYLQGMSLQDVNFSQADLAGAVFTDTFGIINSVGTSFLTAPAR